MKALYALIALLLILPVNTFAKTKPTKSTMLLLKCNSSGCKEPRKGREDASTHLAFAIEKAKSLLKDRKQLKNFKLVQKDLIERRSILEKKQSKIYEIQITQADKTIKSQSKKIAIVEQRNTALTKDNQKLNVDVAKYKGERYKFLVIGFGVGVGVAFVVGISAVVYLKFGK